MASWKWVAGGATAAVGIIAAPVADSLVKEGKFPDGLGAVVTILWGWLSAHVSVPVWAILLALLLAGMSLRGVIMLQRQTPEGGETMSNVAQLRQDLHRLTEHHAELKATNKQLRVQVATATELQESQRSESAAFEVEIARQRDANAELKEQLATTLQLPTNVELELPTYASKVLSIIAGYANIGIEPSLLILSTSGEGQVATEGAIDILLEHQMVRPKDRVGGATFALTSKGRAHFLKQREVEKRQGA